MTRVGKSSAHSYCIRGVVEERKMLQEVTDFWAEALRLQFQLLQERKLFPLIFSGIGTVPFIQDFGTPDLMIQI